MVSVVTMKRPQSYRLWGLFPYRKVGDVKLVNGEIPKTSLTRVSTGHLLRADAAKSFERLALAFYVHFGKALIVTDAYRDLAQQIAVRKLKGVFAAVPGTSNHGWGIALDLGSRVNISTSAEHAWMVANAGAYGWVNPWWARNDNPSDGQFEPWHWEYDAGKDTKAIDQSISALLPQEESSMFILSNQVAGHHQKGVAWMVINGVASVIYGDAIDGFPVFKVTNGQTWTAIERTKVVRFP